MCTSGEVSDAQPLRAIAIRSESLVSSSAKSRRISFLLVIVLILTCPAHFAGDCSVPLLWTNSPEIATKEDGQPNGDAAPRTGNQGPTDLLFDCFPRIQ